MAAFLRGGVPLSCPSDFDYPRATPKPALFCTAGWEFLWARRHLQLIVNALNLFSLMLNGLAE